MSRVLITGLATYWGGRLAQVLEEHPDVELIVGVDRRAPNVELERTEFVRVREDYGALRRIVEAAEIDTILHTHLLVDSTAASSRWLHEQNVIGTMNLLAAAATTDSPVRRVIVKSSTLVYGSGRGDPMIFRETMRRSNPPRTQVERTLIEVEDYVRDFAEDNPHVSVTLLRVANVIAADHDTPMLTALRRPAVPAVFGFDPLIQVVHVEDC
ncbi:MAG: NAD-dependent epimerase/dehydratase family protein, partial [Actinobacteria bacterium ATB1]|nr:NAD-dependent epimerase/dehydratase family protein [Actinobacteria bacterium ATB1]